MDVAVGHARKRIAETEDVPAEVTEATVKAGGGHAGSEIYARFDIVRLEVRGYIDVPWIYVPSVRSLRCHGYNHCCRERLDLTTARRHELQVRSLVQNFYGSIYAYNQSSALSVTRFGLTTRYLHIKRDLYRPLTPAQGTPHTAVKYM